MTDDEFLAAFESCSLARKEWTHEAHVRMAWIYAARTPSFPDTLQSARTGIQKLNANFLQRKAATCMRQPSKKPDARGLDGYHETITTAFVTVIASRVVAGESYDAFRDRNPDLYDRSFPALLQHYSPCMLYSETAKCEFVKPDLEPLPAV